MYRFDLVMTGFPGRSTEHGPLGWSTVGLLRGDGRTVLVDTGGPAYREPLLLGLRQRGVSAQDVTDVLITHCHWDHVSNFTLFPRARVTVPGAELDWAAAQAPGTWHLAELHVARLASGTDDVVLAAPGQEVAPGITAVATPGHTPGHFAYRATTADGEV
ncbi:MAG TPA: MBL fold metallo-hydrolase, partial [Acidimicrobiales bacterium]|nr:MBL fold metallo-hydrolase [Acidimicrobiales bacterium]